MLKDFLKFIIIEPINFKLVVLHINYFLDKPHPVLIIPWNISILCFDITCFQSPYILSLCLKEDTPEIPSSY